MAFKITHYAYEHKQGTKEYEITHVFDQESGREVLISRWGKVGRLVGKKVIPDHGAAELDRARAARQSRGYAVRAHTTDIMSATHAKAAHPQAWALYVEHCGGDPDGVDEAIRLEVTDGTFETIRLEREPPPPPVETATDNNPLLGIF